MKVGDKVVVKGWEEMKKEYGMTKAIVIYQDSINIPFYFLESMQRYCNKRYRIEFIEDLEWDNQKAKAFHLEGVKDFIFPKEALKLDK